jgi:hypothetical protein
MKRSEMISRGVGYLIDQEKMCNMKIDLNKRELVDYLLACFERQGMLPPIWDGMSLGRWVSPNPEIFEVFTWQNEDE